MSYHFNATSLYSLGVRLDRLVYRCQPPGFLIRLLGEANPVSANSPFHTNEAKTHPIPSSRLCRKKMLSLSPWWMVGTHIHVAPWSVYAVFFFNLLRIVAVAHWMICCHKSLIAMPGSGNRNRTLWRRGGFRSCCLIEPRLSPPRLTP